MGEIHWLLPWRRLDKRAVLDAAQTLAARMEDVSIEVDEEEPGCVSCLFIVEDPEEPYVVELSFYEVDGDVVLALEEEWADNADAWDAACGIAEEMAEVVGGQQLEL
ncbi:MAG: hypothetical protein H6739_18055 [Alphaproteobacteria bacterium]|nr:hypothetical protein [Alphaproteobacteria bacterium]